MLHVLDDEVIEEDVIPEESEDLGNDVFSTTQNHAMSILDSVKTMLNINLDDHAFDIDIAFAINSALSTLQQLGVGPKDGFEIISNAETWSDFITGPMYNMVRQYVFLKVRVIFDPPSNSYLVTNLNDRISELEWRLMVASESIFDELPDEEDDKENFE